MKTILRLLLCLGVCMVLGASDPPDCPSGGHCYLPNPDDCSSYFECFNGTAHLMYCPDGLYFNPKVSICDYLVNVECNSSWFQGVSGTQCYCPRTNSYGTRYECHFSLSWDDIPCRINSPCMLRVNEEC